MPSEQLKMPQATPNLPFRATVADPKRQNRLLPGQPFACIIILNWNHWQETLDCLDSLRALEYQSFEVIVVDNASTNDSVAQIQSRFPEVTLIRAERNLGFAGGCNVGIREALWRNAKYVWLLNNDTKVHPSSLIALVEKAEADPTLGAVGSAIYYMDDRDRLQCWGGGYVRIWLGYTRHYLAPVGDRRIGYITGASLLLKTEAIHHIGLLDEQFFMYWEDVDYSLRLRRAGWRLAVAAPSIVWHKGCGSTGKSSPQLDVYLNASAVRFFRKYSRLPRIPLFITGAYRISVRLAKGDWNRVRAVRKGLRESDLPPNNQIPPVPSTDVKSAAH